jgi:hypothetical protein
MALTIQDPETERMARQLAEMTGRSIEEAVTEALRKALARDAELRERQKP